MMHTRFHFLISRNTFLYLRQEFGDLLNLHSTIMGSYGRRSGKLALDSFRNCFWSIMPKTQILPSNKRPSQFEHSLIPAWNRAKFRMGVSSHSLASQRLSLQGRANTNIRNPFLNEARRFYYVDRYNNVRQHGKSKGLKWWFRVGVLIVTFCSGAIVKTYYDHLEIVPYHKRTRLILFSESKMKSLTEMHFKEKSKFLEGKILPDTHLESIRVRRIAQDVINACKDEIQRQGSQLSTSYLDGSDWEVLVVRGFGSASSVVCGKIVLYDWIFEHITTDDEIAFLVGREIGALVARHYAESFTLAYCFKVLKPILNPIGLWAVLMDKYAKSVFRIFWKQEVEADYIGMRLSALAGYDPRVAPKLLKKIDKFSIPHIVNLTPKMRAECLSVPEVMEVPLSIYLRGCLK